jgi:hypothetical protein
VEGGQGGEKGKQVRWVSGLRDVNAKQWKSMTSRLGRPEGSVGVRKSQV